MARARAGKWPGADAGRARRARSTLRSPADRRGPANGPAQTNRSPRPTAAKTCGGTVRVRDSTPNSDCADSWQRSRHVQKLTGVEQRVTQVHEGLALGARTAGCLRRLSIQGNLPVQQGCAPRLFFGRGGRARTVSNAATICCSREFGALCSNRSANRSDCSHKNGPFSIDNDCNGTAERLRCGQFVATTG